MESSAAGGFVDFSRFSAMREQARTDQGGAMAEVADEFEALFVDLMLKAARKAEVEGGLFDSNALSTYREMFDHQIALTLAHNNDLGIGRVMARQINGLLGADERPAGDSERPATEVAAPFSELRRYRGPERAGAAEPVDGRQPFINRLGGYAEQAGRELGVSGRAVLAQAALESGWGQHVIRRGDGTSSHNYFGIKAGTAWHGDTVKIETTEYVAGRAITIEAEFRAYDSPAEAFRDYAGFLAQNPRYREVLNSGANEAKFAEQLAAAGYATDPRYAEKIIAILETGLDAHVTAAPGAH